MVSPVRILPSNSSAMRPASPAQTFRPVHLATQPVLIRPLLAITGLYCATRLLVRPQTEGSVLRRLRSLTATSEPSHRQDWVECCFSPPRGSSCSQTEIQLL